LRAITCIVVVASALGVFAFWFDTTAVNHFTLAPVLSADVPVPTCQAVYEPTAGGTCARRNVTPCPDTGPAATDTCNSAARDTLATQYETYLQECSAPADDQHQRICADMGQRISALCPNYDPGRPDPCAADTPVPASAPSLNTGLPLR
jgi:hypothetical protein